MNIENQARESAATERQHQKQRETAMDTRAKAETQSPNRDGIEESAREHTTHQRQQEENRQSKMQRRAQDNS